ncbi:hypothetical protein GT354_12150, partial [Streptomyces sp. SID3343]|nr:hypothetical protein [Streptomyces sp. SID3343]
MSAPTGHRLAEDLARTILSTEALSHEYDDYDCAAARERIAEALHTHAPHSGRPHSDPRCPGPQCPDPPHSDPQCPDPQHPGPQHPGSQCSGLRHPDALPAQAPHAPT